MVFYLQGEVERERSVSVGCKECCVKNECIDEDHCDVVRVHSFFFLEGVNVEVSVCVLNFHACVIGSFQQWLSLLNLQCVVNLSGEESTIRGQPSRRFSNTSHYSSDNSLSEQSASNAIVLKFASSGSSQSSCSKSDNSSIMET